MKLYVQLMIIFSISIIGEGISSVFHLPIPGSIIGLILLFLALQFKLLRLRHVSMVGNFLLANMTILFLPPAVGIMDKFHVIAPYHDFSENANFGIFFIIKKSPNEDYPRRHCLKCGRHCPCRTVHQAAF